MEYCQIVDVAYERWEGWRITRWFMASYTLNRGMPTRQEQYEQYINSFAWREKRRETFAFHGKQCLKCHTTGNLHVHHKTYARLFKENVETDLIPLCNVCHDKLHDFHNKNKHKGWHLSHSSEMFLKRVEQEQPKKKKKKHHRIKYKGKSRFYSKHGPSYVSEWDSDIYYANAKRVVAKKSVERVKAAPVKQKSVVDVAALMKQYNIDEQTAMDILGRNCA